MTTSSIQISFTEAFKWFGGVAKAFALSPIPDAERVTIVLERMRSDVAEKKIAYINALKAEATILDPEDDKVGTLAVARARQAKYEAQGQAWGSEFSRETTSKKRKAELTQLMNEADATITALVSEIGSLEAVLKTRQETTRLRKNAYEAAQADYTKLKTLAPAMVAQTKALEEAQAERMQAIRDTGGKANTNSDAVIQQLTGALEAAKAGDRAAELVGDEEGVDKPSLDELIEQEAAAAATKERVNRWTSK